jgi:hypothetical protein
MELEEGEIIENDDGLDIHLHVCYCAIFGISDIKREHLAQLTEWDAFIEAHFEHGRSIRTLANLADNFHYVLDAFDRHDFLFQYWEKFGETDEYLAEHVVSSKAIRALCCLDWA